MTTPVASLAPGSSLPVPDSSRSFPNSHFPSPLTEADLSQLWLDQTFPPEALTTSEGERLRVIYRGRRTGGPGPDFRDALIAAPAGLLRGDIELHVRSSDFRRHGHGDDPAYEGVVLHLVFRADEPGATALPGGGQACVVALENWVEGRALEIQRWLERPSLWREPCLSAVARDGAPAVAATLERLGDMRFRQKAAAFAARLREMRNEKWETGERGSQERGVRSQSSGEVEEVMWEALLQALGYGGERESYRSLADRVPWAALRRALTAVPANERAGTAYARLIAGAAGLFTRKGPTRPANRPEGRLQGAAALAARCAEKGLLGHFVGLLDGAVEERKSKVAERKNGKRKARQGESGQTPVGSTAGDFSSSFLDSRRLRSAVSEQTAVSALIAALIVPGVIGRSRAVEMGGNAVLPVLAALGSAAQARWAEALYARLPLPARYGAVRHLHEAMDAGSENRGTKEGISADDFRFSIFDFSRTGGENGRRKTLNGSDAPGSAVRVDFRRQQGMLYLLKQYCTQGGCGRCPLS